MGETIRWVVSVDEETAAIAEKWEGKLSPFADGNRSLLVRLLFKLWDTFASHYTLNALVEAIQATKGIKTYQRSFDFSAFPTEKKPPRRAVPQAENPTVRRLAFSRLSEAGRLGEEMAASHTSILGRPRPHLLSIRHFTPRAA